MPPRERKSGQLLAPVVDELKSILLPFLPSSRLRRLLLSGEERHRLEEREKEERRSKDALYEDGISAEEAEEVHRSRVERADRVVISGRLLDNEPVGAAGGEQGSVVRWQGDRGQSSERESESRDGVYLFFGRRIEVARSSGFWGAAAAGGAAGSAIVVAAGKDG